MTYIQKRNLVTCILLSLVTCGIYTIYWEVMIAKEMVSLRDSNDSGTLEIVCMIFIPFLGCFLAERKFYEGATRCGLNFSDNSVLYLILGIFALGIVNLALMQNDLNNAYDMLTGVGAQYQQNYGANYQQPPYGDPNQPRY